MPNQWNEGGRIKQGCIVDGIQYDSLNKKINEMDNFISDYFNSSEQRSQKPSLQDLRERFYHRFRSNAEAQSNEFFYMFDKFIAEVGSQNGWKKDMNEVYKRLKEKVRTFKPDISFSDLSVATMEKFKVALSKDMYNDALDKHLTYFKSFIKWAQARKCPIHEEFFTYRPKLKKAKKAIRYLKPEEVETIYKLDLHEIGHLERVRDIFIFQCYTALRISDIRRLKHENIIKETNGDYSIDILTKKDNDRLYYKLADRAVEMYLKYKDNKYEDDLVFPVISPQKYNKYLTEVGKKAELKGYWVDYRYRLEKVIETKTAKTELSSHTARRTFISTALNAGMSSDLVAYITSHSDIKSMRPYIKIDKSGTDKVIDAINKITKEKEETTHTANRPLG